MGGVTAAVVARASASHASRARMPLPVQQVAGEFPSFSVCLPEGRSVSQSVNHHFQYTYNYTSSTAQGGGGSVKNRKPIGKVGCCESGMAERIH